VPGPGTYKLPESCQIKQPKHQAASYRSRTKRELGNHILGKHNPGIGQYDLTGFNSIGVATLEGGGAPNNFTLCYKDQNPTIRKVETRPSPRLAPAHSNTPHNVGPGVYSADPGTRRMEEKYRPSKLGKKDTNWASLERFKNSQLQTTEEVGPGAYKVGQKWTKRTYNLKFLDGNGTRHKSPQGPLGKTLAQRSSPTSFPVQDPGSQSF